MSTKLSSIVVNAACEAYEKQATALGMKLPPGWRERIEKRASFSEEAPVLEALGTGAGALIPLATKQKHRGLVSLLNFAKAEAEHFGKTSEAYYVPFFNSTKTAELIDPLSAAVGFPVALGIGGRLAGRALGDIAAHGRVGARAGLVGASKKTIADLGKLMGPASGAKGARYGTLAGALLGLPLGLAAYNRLREERLKKSAAATKSWDPVLAVLKRSKLPLLPGKKRARKAMLAAGAGATVKNLPELLLAGLIGGGGGLALHKATELST